MDNEDRALWHVRVVSVLELLAMMRILSNR